MSITAFFHISYVFDKMLVMIVISNCVLSMLVLFSECLKYFSVLLLYIIIVSFDEFKSDPLKVLNIYTIIWKLHPDFLI